jgi:hypothetical protein
MPIANNPITASESSREPDPQVHSDVLLDEALEETFPASDPISPSTESSERHPDSGKSKSIAIQTQKSGSAAIPGQTRSPANGPVGLDPVAFWDARQGVFRIRIHQSPTFAELLILKDAPLPLAHLDTTAHNGKTALGAALHNRLEAEVNAAIARGGHQVATGMFLATPEEKSRL